MTIPTPEKIKAKLSAIEENSDIGLFDDAQGIVMSEFSHARIVHHALFQNSARAVTESDDR